MKPRNREINIFNLSMLDVICGALGAFLILFLVAAPYYGNTSTQQDVDSGRNTFDFIGSWEVRNADIDVWIFKPDRTWAGPKDKRLFGRIKQTFEFGDNKAAYQDTTYWEAYSRRDPDAGGWAFVYHYRPGSGQNAEVTVRGVGLLNLNVGGGRRNEVVFRPVSLRPGETRIAGVMFVTRDGRPLFYEFGMAWNGEEWPQQVARRLAGETDTK
ncbi:MAG: hypothetical protein J0H09_20610 [Burkholderiales bacterium]|nr:hypothetical protein [Burkholderiales bacterium]